jgi:hypothetical protein
MAVSFFPGHAPFELALPGYLQPFSPLLSFRGLGPVYHRDGLLYFKNQQAEK